MLLTVRYADYGCFRGIMRWDARFCYNGNGLDVGIVWETRKNLTRGRTSRFRSRVRVEASCVVLPGVGIDRTVIWQPCEIEFITAWWTVLTGRVDSWQPDCRPAAIIFAWWHPFSITKQMVRYCSLRDSVPLNLVELMNVILKVISSQRDK